MLQCKDIYEKGQMEEEQFMTLYSRIHWRLRKEMLLKTLTVWCLSFIMLVSKPQFLCFSTFGMFWTVQEWMASSSCFLWGDLQSHRSCSMKLGRFSVTRWKLSFHR